MRMIDADTLIKNIKNTAVDIVRCKECKRFGDEGWCFWRDVRIEPDDYCSYGERIECDE